MAASEINSKHDAVGVVDDDHQVVVFAVPDDVESLESVLVKLPHMDAPTVHQIVHTLPGIVPGRLTRSKAAAAATQIRELGVHATAIPGSDIPVVSHAVPVHHVRVSQSALEVIDFRDQSRSWSADDIDVLSVGLIPSSATAHHRPPPAAAMGSSHRVWNEGAHIKAKKRPAALIVLHDGTVLSLSSDAMNYEYLEDRLGTSSSVNFATMIRDLRQLAAGAWVTPSTRSFLDHAPRQHFEFRTEEDFQRYTQFQTLLKGQFGRQH